MALATVATINLGYRPMHGTHDGSGTAQAIGYFAEIDYKNRRDRALPLTK